MCTENGRCQGFPYSWPKQPLTLHFQHFTSKAFKKYTYKYLLYKIMYVVCCHFWLKQYASMAHAQNVLLARLQRNPRQGIIHERFGDWFTSNDVPCLISTCPADRERERFPTSNNEQLSEIFHFRRFWHIHLPKSFAIINVLMHYCHCGCAMGHNFRSVTENPF